MSKSEKHEWADSPIYQALNGVSARLRSLKAIRKQLREEEDEARKAIKQALNAYFAACNEHDVVAEHRIDMLDGTEIVINDDWYDMDELKAVSLHELPHNVITIVNQLKDKEAAGAYQ